MKDGKILVIESPHQGDRVIENVVNYMVNSPFAERDEIISNAVRTDSVLHMIEDFYAVQSQSDMDRHRRLFHLILTTRASGMMDTILEDGALALRDHFALLGHQVLLVPHYGSEGDYKNHHWHAAVNTISYRTGRRLLDKYETFNALRDHLNQHTRSSWTWQCKQRSR